MDLQLYFKDFVRRTIYDGGFTKKYNKISKLVLKKVIFLENLFGKWINNLL